MTSRPPTADGQSLLQVFREYLREHNQPVTHQREAVAATVFFADAHLAVDEIERRLADQGVHVGRATIYRTLQLLVTADLIHERDFGEGFKRYEVLETRGHHEHLVCTSCGRVVEFLNDRLERMNALVAEEHGFRLQRYRLEIYGTCRDCQEKNVPSLGAGPTRKLTDR